MANHRRSLIIHNGSKFHVTWKCHNDDWLLKPLYAKRTYYNLLLKYKNKYGMKFHSYCFMDNHPHLTGTCTTQKQFSDFFRVVNSCLAKTINKNLKRKGQVVMDRFKSPQIETQHDLLHVMFYGDMNPYRTKRPVHPDEFKFSSYHHYARGIKDPLLTEPECYLNLGATEKERQTEYRKRVSEIIKSDWKDPKAKTIDLDRVYFIGNPEWVCERYKILKSASAAKRRLLKNELPHNASPPCAA